MRIAAHEPLPSALDGALGRFAADGLVTRVACPAGAWPERADVLLAAADGVLPLLRGTPRGLPVALLAVWGARPAALAALEAGADLWVDEAEDGDALLARLTAAVRRRLPVATRIDALTGLPGPEQFHELLEHEFDRARRYRRALALAALAPDVAGESGALLRMAAALRGTVRDVDTLARYGRETLVLLLPETDARGAVVLGQRLHEAVAGTGAGAATSAGVAAIPARGIEAPRDLLGRALEALEQARRAGGGRVVAFGSPDVIWSRDASNPARFLEE